MQKLVFEDAWNRTISQKDREEIELIFHHAVSNLHTGVTFSTVRIAINYKNELLVTAIVHNKTEQNLVFENTPLQVHDGDLMLADHTFTLPALQVPPETSMPWTFIFPAGSFEIPDSNGPCPLHKKNNFILSCYYSF
ncbi:SLAP domain-containing protein [Bacillus timonensis]|uniref:SLAP domain-containing protein n=1 Tax=Bacillus timonensis TaxID=1033734 RepID=UPI0002885819|nr:SLAP domain-containing protein [Bacillus timonensis]